MKNIALFFSCIIFFLACSSKVETIKVELLPLQQKNTNIYTDSYLQRANQFFSKEEYDSTLIYCHKSYAKNSQNWELFTLYGKTASKIGKYKRAEDYLYKALTYCNSDNVNRAKIYFALGENDDLSFNSYSAKQNYLMVIQLDSGSNLAQIASQRILLLSQAE